MPTFLPPPALSICPWVSKDVVFFVIQLFFFRYPAYGPLLWCSGVYTNNVIYILIGILPHNLSILQLTQFIIQHIATLPKYGHGALNIRRLQSTDILRFIRNFVCRGEKGKLKIVSSFSAIKLCLKNKTIILLTAHSCGISPDFGRLGRSIRRCSARFRRTILKYNCMITHP